MQDNGWGWFLRPRPADDGDAFCHMHGPEHHVMVGAALLTAYKNAGGELDLEPALQEIASRGRYV